MNIYIFISLIISLSFASISSNAQNTQLSSQNSGLSVAILDLNSIRRDSLVVKNIREQIEIFREVFRKNIKKVWSQIIWCFF